MEGKKRTRRGGGDRASQTPKMRKSVRQSYRRLQGFCLVGSFWFPTSSAAIFSTPVCVPKKNELKKKKIAPHPSSSGLHTAGHTKKAEEQQQQRGEPTSRIIMCIEVFAAFIHEFEHAPRLHPVLSSPLLPPDPQCDSCALAKRKCDGKSTCSLCLKRASPCVYSEVS